MNDEIGGTVALFLHNSEEKMLGKAGVMRRKSHLKQHNLRSALWQALTT